MIRLLRVVVLIHIAAGLVLAQPAPTTRVAASDHFDFHSDPWISSFESRRERSWSRRFNRLGVLPEASPQEIFRMR